MRIKVIKVKGQGCRVKVKVVSEVLYPHRLKKVRHMGIFVICCPYLQLIYFYHLLFSIYAVNLMSSFTLMHIIFLDSGDESGGRLTASSLYYLSKLLSSRSEVPTVQFDAFLCHRYTFHSWVYTEPFFAKAMAVYDSIMVQTNPCLGHT